MLNIEEVGSGELKFIGRFDASQAEKATEELAGKTETIIIDMSELEYISSMGLGILVSTFKRLEEKGHTLKLKNLNNHVRDVFKFTKLDQVLEIL